MNNCRLSTSTMPAAGWRLRKIQRALSGVLTVVCAVCARSDAAYMNFESPQVHPVDLSPSGKTLAVCNTAARSIQLFDLTGAFPQPTLSIAVGLDPVTVRFRTDTEAWVANFISDSISIIDLQRGCVVETLATMDEPADIVFAGSPKRAFVS